MLVEKRYKVGDIKAFKLISGEDVIAKIEEVTSDEVILRKPQTLVQTQQGVGMAYAFMLADPTVDMRVPLSSIAICYETTKEVRDTYTQATTDIVTFDKKIIT